MKTSMSIMFILFSFIFSFFSICFHDQNFSILVNFSVSEINSAQYSLSMWFNWKLFSLGAIICLITGNINIFSMTYMKSDKFNIRFISILSMFAISMLWTIATSKNIMTMLIGWDFLGLTSLLLIMHYQSNYVYTNSFLTFTLNRLGDIAFIIAGAFMFSSGSWSFLSLTENKNIILFILSIAAFTKSAQLPFSTWLPKAMAAPTPVSSLVHSSTLVTAGVILLLNTEPLIKNSFFSWFFLSISIFTMFISSLAGCITFDLKKIIAFSTMSQISFMMMILIMGSAELAFLHLLTHALFKSLMFLAAGTIIHHSGGEQDIRKISNMNITLPLESFMMCLSLFALMGFPFLAGYYSKDLIIEYFSNNLFSFYLLLLTDFCICLTSFYSLRIILCVIDKSVSKNTLLSWISTNNEKFVMLSFFFFIVCAGSIISWCFIKMWNIDYPLSIKKKSFGLWGFILSFVFTFYIMKKINTAPILDFFRSIGYFNYFMILLVYIFSYLSFYIMLFQENMWNKFLSINAIMNVKKILINSMKIFNSWSIFKFMILFMLMLMIINFTM